MRVDRGEKEDYREGRGGSGGVKEGEGGSVGDSREG